MGLLLLLVRKERGLLLGTAGSLLTCNLVWISVHPTLHLAKTTSSSPLLLAVSFIPIRRAVHPFSRNVQQSRGCLFTKNLVISSLSSECSGSVVAWHSSSGCIDYFQLQPTKSYPLTQTTSIQQSQLTEYTFDFKSFELFLLPFQTFNFPFTIIPTLQAFPRDQICPKTSGKLHLGKAQNDNLRG